MQNIRVNNKFFRSISEAAKFLHISKPYLHAKMKDKQAITYKDLLVEKVEVPKQKKVIKPRKRGIPVLIDGIPYMNCAEAERAIGVGSSTVSDALRRGAKTVAGHKVEAIYPSMVNKKKKYQHRGTCTPVLCITTGKRYDSINEAADAANCDSWTMSKKMETSGGFIDENGNEYQRLKPMNTKNIYEDTGKTLNCKKSYTSKTVAESFVPIDTALETAKAKREVLFPNKTDAKPQVPQVVKDAINDKIIKLLKDNGIYTEIVELLNYGGFSTIKIKTDE